MNVLVPDWRSPEERFGLYVVRNGELELLATGSSARSMGLAFGILLEEGDLEGIQGLGVLDSHGTPDRPGVWLVNPFERIPRRITL